MTREIPLTRGLVAIVDDEDYERASAKRWCALGPGKSRRGIYAQHYWREGKKVRAIGLGPFILRPPAGLVVDHIDGDPLNNTRANLRACTPAQNMLNRPPHRRWASEQLPKGVYRYKGWATFQARISVGGKTFILGRFATCEEASRAYDAAAIKHHGEFARLNSSEAA